MMQRKHYRPHRSQPWCLHTTWPGALTQETWKAIYMNTSSTTTDIRKVTCEACLRQMKFDITNKLGGRPS